MRARGEEKMIKFDKEWTNISDRLRDYIDNWFLEHQSDLEYIIELFYRASWDEEKTHESFPQVGFTIDVDPSFPKLDGSNLAEVFHFELYTDDDCSFDFNLMRFDSDKSDRDLKYETIASSSQKFEDWINIQKRDEKEVAQ